jgi:hypothetical protein
MSIESGFLSLGISATDIVQALLIVLAILLWQVLKWLKLIAKSLGCNPHRTKSIQELQKQMDRWYHDSELGRRTKLTDSEKEKVSGKLDELYDYELFESPCKAGQGIRIIERLQEITKLLDSRLPPSRTK